jgi:chlorophyll synthase
MAGGHFPGVHTLVLAGLYSAGAHGIMTLNDFKSVKGDRQMGIGSLPVRLGVENAARAACVIMAVPQVIVVLFLIAWQAPGYAISIGMLLLVQLAMMDRFLEKPLERALWYSGFGVPLYVGGMLVSAFALRAAGS